MLALVGDMGGDSGDPVERIENLEVAAQEGMKLAALVPVRLSASGRPLAEMRVDEESWVRIFSFRERGADEVLPVRLSASGRPLEEMRDSRAWESPEGIGSWIWTEKPQWRQEVILATVAREILR